MPPGSLQSSGIEDESFLIPSMSLHAVKAFYCLVIDRVGNPVLVKEQWRVVGSDSPHNTKLFGRKFTSFKME